MRAGLALGFGLGLAALTGCSGPPSRFPDGQAALDRMKSIYECSRGVKAEAKLDHKSPQGRIRGDLSFFAVDPANVRFSIFSPFGAELATLTSDGQRFAFNDTVQKRFLEGPASACNIAKLTQVPVPAHALVSLLQGRAPLLVHEPGQVSIRWKSPFLGVFGKGYYEVEIPSKHGAVQTLSIEIPREDMGKPWSEQRLRVTEVRVVQQSAELYRAKLSDFHPAEMGKPVIDEEGLDPPLLPIGPECKIEVPRRILVEVPVHDDNVRFEYKRVEVNPTVPEGVFVQMQLGGTQRLSVGACEQGWLTTAQSARSAVCTAAGPTAWGCAAAPPPAAPSAATHASSASSSTAVIALSASSGTGLLAPSTRPNTPPSGARSPCGSSRRRSWRTRWCSTASSARPG